MTAPSNCVRLRLSFDLADNVGGFWLTLDAVAGHLLLLDAVVEWRDAEGVVLRFHNTECKDLQNWVMDYLEDLQQLVRVLSEDAWVPPPKDIKVECGPCED